MAEPAIALDRFVRENPAEAVVRLRAVLDEDRRNAEAWRLLGRALRQLGRGEEAAEA
jgi:cytochrome c-type biogenesis protein CcmH/NrfG